MTAGVHDITGATWAHHVGLFVHWRKLAGADGLVAGLLVARQLSAMLPKPRDTRLID